MSVSCTWVRARRHGDRNRGRGCTLTARGPERVIREVSRGVPMTVPELRRAAVVLGRHVRSGRMDVAVARFRVAVRLEQLGA
jgi:hypothetical protein